MFDHNYNRAISYGVAGTMWPVGSELWAFWKNMPMLHPASGIRVSSHGGLQACEVPTIDSPWLMCSLALCCPLCVRPVCSDCWSRLLICGVLPRSLGHWPTTARSFSVDTAAVGTQSVIDGLPLRARVIASPSICSFIHLILFPMPEAAGRGVDKNARGAEKYYGWLLRSA
jgi:hypothetical protein